MSNYIFRKVLAAIPTLFGVALITFIVFYIAGGDPIVQLAGKYASPEQIAELRSQYGLDQPLPFQFLKFLKQIVTFDFERSFQTKQTISKMLLDGAWVSFTLAFPAFILSELISIAFALLAAARRNRFADRAIVMISTLGMSVSILAYILLGQYFLAYKWNLFPISGYEPGFSGLAYLALPWIIWILVSLGGDIRFYRTVFLEELQKDYVRTAKAKGLSRSRILFVHVLRNALVPIITRMVIAIPFLMTGSLLIENFFGIPGLGNLMVEALNNADWPVIKAVTILGSSLYVIFHLLSDVLYVLADPRVESLS